MQLRAQLDRLLGEKIQNPSLKLSETGSKLSQIVVELLLEEVGWKLIY